MACNCGGSKRQQQKTGTVREVDQGEGRRGWYYTGPKGPKPAADQQQQQR